MRSQKDPSPGHFATIFAAPSQILPDFNQRDGFNREMIQLIRHLWSHFANEDLTLTAAALSFTTVLSIVPFLAVSLAALNYFDALERLTPKVEAAVLENFSGAAGTEGVQLMKKGIARIQRGKMGSLGAIILIVISTRLMMGLERSFHRIWQIKNKRPWAQRFFYYWLFMLLFPFLLALWAAFFTSVGNPIVQNFPVRPGFVMTGFILFSLQKWLPSIRVRTGPALLGTFFSLTFLFILERSFKILSAEVFSYGKVYGSFAAIPASLLWIFMVWVVILWGVALTASFQKGTAAT